MTRRTSAGRWELASRLRALRLERGLTLDDVAKRLYCSPAKVSRLENGRRGAQLDDVRALADIYGLSVTQTRELLALTEDIRSEPSWHLTEASATIQKYVQLEAGASTILWAEGSIVPGLLQTSRYTTALLTMNLPILTEAPPVESWVASRTPRQRRLVEEPVLRLDAVLDEATVRRAVGGPEVMLEQVSHLLRVARLDNVDLRLIPFEAGSHPAMEGPIVILRFAEEQRLADCVFVEGLIGSMFFEDHPSVARYTHAFELLASLALSPAASREFLLAVADDWRVRRDEAEPVAG